MTKRELLNAISLAISEMQEENESRLTWKDTTVEIAECRNLQSNLKMILSGVSDDNSLGKLSSLADFANGTQFKDFCKTSTSEQIKKCGERICTDLMTMMQNAVDLTTIQTVQAMEHKRSNIVTLFLVLLGLTVVALLTVQILSLCNVLQGVENIISSVIGAVDLLLGFVFFAYERHDDTNKKTLYRQAAEAKKQNPEDFVKHYNVSAKGDNNVIVIGNNNKVKTKSISKKINEYDREHRGKYGK